MWTKYRKWKHGVVPPLVVLTLFLMRGEPDESAMWTAGITLAALLTLAYLAEEIVWMIRKRGRPCPRCGRMAPVRAFRVALRCPHCGQIL
jgi:hypothetical protein